jgi:hypothetical protein
MIPGVIAQTLKRPPPPTHVNISFSIRHGVAVSRNLGLSKTISTFIGQAIAINRSKALPKAIAVHIGQTLAFAPHLNKILIPQIGQVLSYLRRLSFSVRISQTQRVFAPQTQPGNLRATQVTLQVLETTSDVAHLRATQTTMQVLETTSDPTNLRATQVTLQVLRTQA